MLTKIIHLWCVTAGVPQSGIVSSADMEKCPDSLIIMYVIDYNQVPEATQEKH